MKKGYIGPFQLGMLAEVSRVLRIAEDLTRERGVDIEGVFYASAFQAGVDEFVVPEFEHKPSPNSEFLVARTRYLSRADTEAHWKVVRAAFSAYLPNDWERADKSSSIWALQSFLTELLDAMAAGACVLSQGGIPDIAEAEALLPSELSVPLGNLLSAIKDLQAPSPVLQKAIPTEDIQRFNDILCSDVFSKYVVAQYTLEDAQVPVETTLPAVVTSGRLVFSRNPQLLQLRKAGLGILQFTPKLVDAAFGRLPGALADVAAKLGLSLLEERRRVVIYDFSASVHNVMLANILRMVKSATVRDENGRGNS